MMLDDRKLVQGCWKKWVVMVWVLGGHLLSHLLVANEKDLQAVPNSYDEFSRELSSGRKSKEHYLSVCALFTNEARYLREWLEYHLLVGVDHFYLYTNNSTDRFYEVLQPYLTRKLVTLVEWPDYFLHLKEEESYQWVLGTQIPAYENAIKIRAVNETKWLVFLDVEEYLIPVAGNSFKELLEEYDEYQGITFVSDYYDASRLRATPGRNYLIETLELTFPMAENLMKRVEKTIFKPEQCVSFHWPPYQCVFKGGKGAHAVDGSVVRINHYINRFKGLLFFGKNKDKLHVDNRLMSRDQVQELLRMGYEIEDQERSILRFLPEMKKRVR